MFGFGLAAMPDFVLGSPDIDDPFHDKTIVVTRCGRICLGHKKINFSQVFAGQAVGIKEVHDDIWLVSFMDYDLGYFDLETRALEPLEICFAQLLSVLLACRCSGTFECPHSSTRPAELSHPLRAHATSRKRMPSETPYAGCSRQHER